MWKHAITPKGLKLMTMRIVESFILTFLWIIVYSSVHAQRLSANEIGTHIKNEFIKTLNTIEILHQNGKRVEGLAQVRQLIWQLNKSSDKNAERLSDAFFLQAELFFGMYRMERFLASTDSALLYMRTQPSNFRKIRYHLNKARYFNYHALTEKSKPQIDSLNVLISKLSPGERAKMNLASWYSIRINFFRNYDRALLYPIVDSAKSYLSRQGNHELYAQQMLWRTIGNAYMDDCRPDLSPGKQREKKATSAFRKAAQILQQHFPDNYPDRIHVNNLMGLLYSYAGNYHDAKNTFTVSEQLLDEGNLSAGAYTYTHLNTLLWQLRANEEIYRGKDAVRMKKEQLKRWLALAEYWDQWEEENKLNSLQYFRDIYANHPMAVVVQLCHDLFQETGEENYLQTAFWAQEMQKGTFFRKHLMQKAGLTNVPSISLEEIRANLEDDEAIISFSDVSSNIWKSYVLIITRRKASITAIDVGKLFDRSKLFLNTDSVAGNISLFKKHYADAYRFIFGPIEKELPAGIRQLIIYGSGYSNYVNIPLLLQDSSGTGFGNLKYLEKKYQFRFDFSYTIALLRDRIKSEKKASNDQLIAFVPDYANGSLHSLPFFQQQAQWLQKKFDGQMYHNGNATAKQFREMAPNAGVLHIAAHGMASKDFAGDGKIILDGHQDALDMQMILQQKLNAKLTVLALCESGVGERVNSYLNMAYWFAYAGSESCIFSYWRLDDRSTSIIINDFYRLLENGHNKSEALRIAKDNYIQNAGSDEERNPLYWAGLTLIGDDAPIEMPERKNHFYWLILALLLTGAGIAWRRKIFTKVFGH